MTIWIMPKSDREGRAVCQFWLQGGIHNETADKKNSSEREPPPPGDIEPSPPPLLKGRNEGANKVP